MDYVFVNISLNYYGANISTISMFSFKITLTFNPVSNRKCDFISLYVNQNLSHIFLYIIMADLNKKDFSVDIQSRLPKVKKIIGCIVKKREAWRAAVHGVAKSQTQLSD